MRKRERERETIQICEFQIDFCIFYFSFGNLFVTFYYSKKIREFKFGKGVEKKGRSVGETLETASLWPMSLLLMGA